MCNILNIIYIMCNTSSYHYYYTFITLLNILSYLYVYTSLDYFYYSVYFSCFILLLCNLAQEFPSGLIKFYLILSYLIVYPTN